MLTCFNSCFILFRQLLQSHSRSWSWILYKIYENKHLFQFYDILFLFPFENFGLVSLVIAWFPSFKWKGRDSLLDRFLWFHLGLHSGLSGLHCGRYAPLYNPKLLMVISPVSRGKNLCKSYCSNNKCYLN